MRSLIDVGLVSAAAVLGLVATADAVDCNLNGIPDEQEIFQFLAADCNMNGILDECELADCCVVHPSAGCSMAACEALVCDVNPNCCDIMWLPSCASLAAQFCPDLCAAPPASDCDRDGTLDECECCGDSDGNGAVDIDDIVAVVLDYGTPGDLRGGDVDGSGLVDIDDIVLVVLRWGDCPPLPCPARDYWTTSPYEVTTITFGGQDVDPIPAGFFGPGSDPFEGQIALVGASLDDESWPRADTIIERSSPVDLQSAPVGWQQPVGVRMKRLSLVTPAPIAAGNEAWSVHVGLAADQPAGGSMIVRKLTATGGEIDQLLLPFMPRIVFAKRTDLLQAEAGLIGAEDVETHVLDWSLEGRPPIVLSWASPMPWSTQPGEGYACPDETFFPGVDQVRPVGGAPAALALSPLSSPNAEYVQWIVPPLEQTVALCRIGPIDISGCKDEFTGEPCGELLCAGTFGTSIARLCVPSLGCNQGQCGLLLGLIEFECDEPHCFCRVVYGCIGCW